MEREKRDLAEGGIQCKLITDAVGRIRLSKLLYRREMDHIVPGLVGHTQPVLPLVEWSECLRQHRLTPDTIHRDSVVHLTDIDYRIHEEIAGTICLFHWVTKSNPHTQLLFNWAIFHVHCGLGQLPTTIRISFGHIWSENFYRLDISHDAIIKQH